MCLILFAWKTHSQYPLVVASNRDEFYARPTTAIDYWEDYPNILAGRDLKAKGTWMGVTKQRRFAALTNYRDGLEETLSNAPSRGDLVGDYLKSDQSPEEYIRAVATKGRQYNGFNLIVGDGTGLWYYANRGNIEPKKLEAGIYGLSNALLDTSWFKLERGKFLFEEQLQSQNLHPRPFLDMLSDTERPPDEQLPQTNIPIEWERRLSSMFIQSENYGTRASTFVAIDQVGQTTVCERLYDKKGRASENIISFE